MPHKSLKLSGGNVGPPSRHVVPRRFGLATELTFLQPEQIKNKSRTDTVNGVRYSANSLFTSENILRLQMKVPRKSTKPFFGYLPSVLQLCEAFVCKMIALRTRGFRQGSVGHKSSLIVLTSVCLKGP